MKKVLVIHGPNLDALGTRERDIYGSISLYELDRLLYQRAEQLGLYLVTYQSNSEEDLIDALHRAGKSFDWVIINPAAFTHTSVALRDAVLASGLPVIEVHLTNVFSREDFRKRSFISDVAKGVISGLGIYSYLLALEFVAHEAE
ncbi:MAG: type II 3-dehydroquinate dehydratase [Deferribacteres bacterium]|nr:type II 3-dehydroquinate dehydratase [Deferribacteres bacterium]